MKSNRARGVSSHQRDGITLLELVVALSVGALIVLGARLLAEQLADASSRIAAASRDADADANGERLLRRLVFSVETGTLPGGTFGGDTKGVHFVSWCETPNGWQERCRVALSVESLVGMECLQVRLPWSRPVTVLRGRRHIELRYLLSAEQGGIWATSWADGPSTPVALGVIRDFDTVVVRVGD